MSFRDSLRLLLFSALLILPGSAYLTLDGIPFVGTGELVVTMFTIAALVHTESRRRLLTLPQRGFAQSIGTTVVVVLILAKVWSFFALPLGDKFEVCIRSLYAPTGETCEKSYDGRFLTRDAINVQGRVTRLDTEIDFRQIASTRPITEESASSSNWNLPFANDFPRFSELWLERLPFAAVVGTRISAKEDSYLPIEFVGSIDVVYSGGLHGEQPPITFTKSSYSDSELVNLPIAKGDGFLRVSFEFAEGTTGTVPDSPPVSVGPYAKLRIGALASEPADRIDKLLEPRPRDLVHPVIRLILMALDLSVLGAIVIALLWATRVTPILLFAGLGALTYGFVRLINSVLPLTTPTGAASLLVLASSATMLLSHRRDSGTNVSAVAIASGMSLAISQFAIRRATDATELLPLNHTMFRPRDSDWLVYEGYARQIFLDESLRAGESTFYFVPGMRYVTYLLRTLFGGSDTIVATVIFSAILSLILCWLAQVASLEISKVNSLKILSLVAFIGIVLRPAVADFVVLGAGEPVAWICVLAAARVSQFLDKSTSVYSAAFLLGVASLVRPNFFPVACLGILLLSVELLRVSRNAHRVARGIVLFAGTVLLALFHNLHYGESLQFFSAGVQHARELSLLEMMTFPFDGTVREILWQKVQFSLTWGRPPGSLLTAIPTWILQATWLITFALVLRAPRRLGRLLILSLPLIYLLSLLPFTFTTLPIRHTISIPLLMTISVLISLPQSIKSQSQRAMSSVS